MEPNQAQYLTKLTKNTEISEGNNKKSGDTVIQMVSFDFKIKIESKEKARVLVNELAVMDGIFNVRINFKDDYEKI